MTATVEKNGVLNAPFDIVHMANRDACRVAADNALKELESDCCLSGNIAAEEFAKNFSIKLDEPICLNLGGGIRDLPGFINIDRKTGGEVYPLAYPDNSVDEIFASHILEHFSHRETAKVLANWVAKLKPGGKIRIAVPDFEKLVQAYLDNAPINLQGYVMGGHDDADDQHRAIFDADTLKEFMSDAGLERIGPWTPEVECCASHGSSLNLMGFKPSGPQVDLSDVSGVLSVPRFGPLMHPRCVERAFLQLRIKGKSGQSCFWHQKISALMEEAIADPACNFVLTMDFDTIFSPQDVLELYRLMHAHPEADAVIPLQSKRRCEQVLMSLTDKDGNIIKEISQSELRRNLLPANTGHFGLTMFRAESLRKFPRPWMVPKPADDGQWEGKGQVDADIDFWKRFKAAGFKPFLAPRVVVGHLEEIIKWPGRDLKAVYQDQDDYEKSGIPAEVVR